jgi:hypothetical protein
MYPLFLSDFSKSVTVSTEFRKILISIFMKILPVGAEFHVDGRTDRRTDGLVPCTLETFVKNLWLKLCLLFGVSHAYFMSNQFSVVLSPSINMAGDSYWLFCTYVPYDFERTL